MKKDSLHKMFPITSVCKADILQAFEGSDNLEQVKQRIAKMDDGEMKYLSSKMADDYCEQLYWSSLKIIFEEKFLEERR
jgi:hypothetical protein